MIASVMIYGATIAVIVALAALAIEHSCTVLKCPRRFVWMLALVSSIALPIASISMKHDSPVPQMPVTTVPIVESATSTDAHPTSIAPISFAIQQVVWPERPNLDRILKALWLVCSLGTLVFYGMEWVRLRHAARYWTRESVDGYVVFVTDQLGPAVVGFVKPDIVLPRWLLAAPLSTRAMILAHERAHIAARDSLMVFIALMLIALAPWNIALLWQLRRLRFAIEVDCDARVLREGAALSASTYGEILLAVGVHNSKTPGIAIALTERASQLERRIRAMVSEAHRHARAIAAACALISVIPVLGCTQLTVPQLNAPATASQVSLTPPSTAIISQEIARLRAEQEAPRQLVALDPAHFDKYVGYYELTPYLVFKVTRKGDKFYDQLTGQRVVELYPESETKFFETVVAAQLSFVSDKTGNVTELILHQNGREQHAPKISEANAKDIETTIADRIINNSPSVGTEPFLRRYLSSVEAGKPDYSEMTPELEGLARQQIGTFSERVMTWGPLLSVEFSRVNPNGMDTYLLTFKNARVPTIVAPTNSQGKVGGLLFQQPILTEAATAALKLRIKENKPSVGTEAFLRNYLVSRSGGQTDYSGMSARLAEALRAQWPAKEPAVMARGALKSLTFLRVNPDGYDVYEVVYEHADMEFRVAPLDLNGKEDYVVSFDIARPK